MATIPTPRSKSSIVGEMIDTLLSKIGLTALKIGSPALSIIEAAAQSDVRSSQDIFNMLDSTSLDRASGQALDRIGADEQTPRFGQNASSGSLTIGDSSFTKISSNVYQGAPAPIIGSTVIYVDSAASFPTTGTKQLYIGRGTTNYEGPLTYTTIAVVGTYYSITIPGGTSKFHNLGETVIFAQGGNRVITAGSIAATPAGNYGQAIQFSTTFAATIPDGETQITNVAARCQVQGTTGNVTSNSVSKWQSAPFTGATVTNPAPFSNGRDTENDQSYRERIRTARNTRSKGTSLAITTGVTGITALDENTRVLSTSLVTRKNEPSVLYIDDATGYEEKTTPVALESLTDGASGGEQYFQLTTRPVPKAFLTTALSAPFILKDESELAVEVGGVRTVHAFAADEFRSLSNASAYEIISSINADPHLLWNARTAGNGTQVVIFAKSDTNENIQIVAVDGGAVDANTALGFPTSLASSVWVYKNDLLLTKDGLQASLTTLNHGSWPVFTSPASITIVIDGITYATTITDSDFVAAGTTFATLNSANTLDSWAAVLNYKLPGVTTTVSGSYLALTSNRGYSSTASLAITSGTLIGLFDSRYLSSVGDTNDYTFDRNLGQIKLKTALAVGDRLSAGTLYTRGFVESSVFNTITFSAEVTSVTGQTGAELWVCVDGGTQKIVTVPGATVDIQLNATLGWGKRVRYVVATGTPFANVLAGDWLIATDDVLAFANKGAYRIAQKIDSNTIEIEQPTAWAATVTGAAFITGGLTVVRSSAIPQRVFLTAGVYTPTTLAAAINVTGATASAYQTTKTRLRTNTFASGDLTIVATNVQGARLGFSGTPAVSGTSHLSSATSKPQAGTPEFLNYVTVSSADSTHVVYTGTNPSSAGILVGLKSLPDSTGLTNPRWGSVDGYVSTIQSQNTGTFTLTLRKPVVNSWLAAQEFYIGAPYAISARDQIGVVVDGDTISKRYVTNMYRKLKPTTNTYGATNVFQDADLSPVVGLGTAFGASFDWSDFAIQMKARVVAKGIMWRYYRHGIEGNNARVQYVYPPTASAAVSLVADARTNGWTNISISLASGAARTLTFRNTTSIGIVPTANDAGNLLTTYIHVAYLAVATGARAAGLVTLTLTLPSPITNHGLVAGNVIWVASTDGNYPTGPKTLTSVTSNTVVYAEAGVTTAFAGTASVSVDPAGANTYSGASIVAGDIVSFNSTINGATGKILSTANDNLTFSRPGGGAPLTNMLTWTPIVSTTNYSVYPLNTGSNSTSAIIASVLAITNTPVTGFENTAGTIAAATYETAANGGLGGVAGPWYTLTDGIQYVGTTSYAAPDYTFTFKDSAAAGLATSTDWLNEDVRITPITTAGVVAYLSAPGVSGLFNAAEVATANASQAPQITTNTPGTVGSVAVTGGTANSVTAAVVGGSTTTTSPVRSTAGFLTSAVNGLTGGWVSLDNTISTPKSIVTALTTLTAFSSTGVVTIAVDKAATAIAGNMLYNKTWQIQRQGNFVALMAASSATMAGVTMGEGDFVVIGLKGLQSVDPAFASGTSQVSAFSPGNCGVYRIVRVDTTNSVIWIENPNAIEELATDDVVLFAYDTVLPGDTMVVNTTAWGTLGNWKVKSLTFSGYTAPISAFTFTVDTSTQIPVSTTSVALGASYSLIQFYDAKPMRLIKKVAGISPNGVLTDVQFTTSNRYQAINSTYGTVMTALDKLNFGTSFGASIAGMDGYAHYTGLIAEANKVVYGDESNISSYPGLAAAGANVNINGPMVRRIQVSLALRTKTGVNTVDITDKVRSAVATVVNNTGVGDPVAISDLVSVAQGVNGVTAVTVLSPTYGVGNDIIAVQPYEKPLVTDIVADVQISFVGA
jgi:hypothetical protein